MRILLRSSPARLTLVTFVLFLLVSFVSRMLLLGAAVHEVSWNPSLTGAFVTGLLFDAASASFAIIPWCFLGILVPDRLWKSRAGGILLLLPMFVFSCLLVFITISEWVFWEEFGARFNFIAVDYLIWTQEVWGNISESYPMFWICAGIATIGGLIVLAMRWSGLLEWAGAGVTTWKDRCAWAAACITFPALMGMGVNQSAIPSFTNQYHGELAKNGCWSFFAAFKQMELEYNKWYSVLPHEQALDLAKKLLATPDETPASPAVDDFRRVINRSRPEKKWNVILVCMESMSGEYMSYLGNKTDLTPCLNRLATQSLFFENLYATGTRTVRGMEALTINLPPTPGQATIYRPEGTNLITTFSPFIDRGYDCAFFYGGDGRFDFMNRYFSTAGCRIMDVGAWNKEDVTMKTSWGACDEDLFRKTLSEADADHEAGRPFHYFCMTTSNHRPFDFPDGRVALPRHSRKGAIQYADWAVGNLIEQASKRPWFKDTLFVIVADHCASSAGKMELDVTKYHIPAMVYNPTLVQPRRISGLCSQIDLMPTVFGLMNWSYETLGYGHDLLAPRTDTAPGRAFVSNYQKIALLREEGIAILKPNRKNSSYRVNMTTGDYSPITADASEKLTRDAMAFYQSASWLFSSGGLKRKPSPPAVSQR